MDVVDLRTSASPEPMLAIDDAINALAEDDPPVAELVKLRYDAGLSVVESGEIIGNQGTDSPVFETISSGSTSAPEGCLTEM